MSLLYIAAPLGAPTAAHRRWNRERAALLCALAFAAGYTPVCVHPYAETAMGPDTDPDARERGLAHSLAAVEDVVEARGALWVLLRDDGTPSAGCVREIEQYNDHWDLVSTASKVWAGWRALASALAPHLLPEFDRLTEPPPGPELTGVWKDTEMRLPWMEDMRGNLVLAIAWTGTQYDGACDGTRTGGFRAVAEAKAAAIALARSRGYVVPEVVTWTREGLVVRKVLELLCP